MSDFTNSTKIDNLAKAIIPDPPADASDAQKAAVSEAREKLKANFLTELGAFIETGLYNIFSTGTPIANDGGAALQTQWKAETS